MRFSLSVALRFLKSGKSQTILIALGIAIGVSVQIFIGLLIQGLQQSLVDRTVGNSSQITVTSKNDDKLIADWEELLSKIGSSDNRIKNISISADASAFIKFDSRTEPVLVRGFDLDKADNIYSIKASIYEGSVFSSPEQILVGKELKDLLSLNKGDKITLTNPKGKNKEFTISGFYDLKVAQINKSWIITDLKAVQELFDFGNSVTSIEMQTTDVFKADEIAVNISPVLIGSPVKVDNWKALNEQLLSGLSGQSISSLMIQVFVLVSVVLGIASVLAISVMQKSKQIGILKAMGVKDRTSSLIFLFQGLFLGVLGAILGIALGLGLIIMFTKFAVNADGTPVVEIYLNYNFIAISGVIAVLSAVLASLIPARKSSKLSPIEVIRNG